MLFYLPWIVWSGFFGAVQDTQRRAPAPVTVKTPQN
jgi:hypothetical protein